MESGIKTLSLTEGFKDIGKIEALKQILSQSTPLIPDIEKAWEDGRNGTALVGNFPFVERRYVNKTSKDYIKNLKLGI